MAEPPTLRPNQEWTKWPFNGQTGFAKLAAGQLNDNVPVQLTGGNPAVKSDVEVQCAATGTALGFTQRHRFASHFAVPKRFFSYSWILA
jgi:hypothetical protein